MASRHQINLSVGETPTRLPAGRWRYKMKEIKFTTTPDDGEVSAILMRPEDATHLMVLGHGAGADMRHITMQTIAERLAENGIATFRYNFPFMEKRKSVGSPKTAIATVVSAVNKANEICPDLPLLAGGHSYGGRMTSHAAAEGKLADVRGLVFFSFPLHAPNKPGDKRAEHLSQIKQPMLFLSGTRDALADMTLFEPVIKNLGKRTTLHLLDTADHSYKILKRTRESKEDVFVEMARVVSEWLPVTS
jgi:predicted alpha/beta-hydrolase family hydrolase